MAFLKRGSAYAGIDPNQPTRVYVEANRPGSPGLWEDVEMTRFGSGFVFRAKAANRMIRLNEQHNLVSYPAGENDGWGGYWLVEGTKATIDGFTLDVEGLAVPAVLEPLRIVGPDFVHPDGSRRVLKGKDAFFAYRQWLDGGPEVLKGAIAESQALKFDLWRLWSMGSKRQNNIADLGPADSGYWDNWRPFVDHLNQSGIYPLVTVFIDAQDVMPDIQRRMTHWRTLADKLRGAQVLLSYGNERDKNGTRDDVMPNPQMLWSRGSWTSDPDPYKPMPDGASFCEFHPNRDPFKSLLDSVASPETLRRRDKITVPIVMDEPPKWGTQGSGPEYNVAFNAWKWARHYSTECAAAVFHDFFGQRGQLMDEHTYRMAEAWQRGMAL